MKATAGMFLLLTETLRGARLLEAVGDAAAGAEELARDFSPKRLT